MPLERYGILKGSAVDYRRENDLDSPHFQIAVLAAGECFRLAVKVLADARPSQLLFQVVDPFRHPMTEALAHLPEGYTEVPRQAGGLAIDYVRGKLLRRGTMRALPHHRPGPDNDLSDRLEALTKRAMREPGAELYSFGERWGPQPHKPDRIFGFTPGNGLHDIHMNQGSIAQFMRDDGTWQDGALLLHFPGPAQWVGIFLAFQTQSWRTDDVTGHAGGRRAPEPSGT